ncbi:MICOS complex subunit Mic10 [Drosophila teissieri]|uniref:MICOS complex subunit Mic10 n=1 Tax=Drosophila teissieri TaxID=7243 RepID=UPI001CB9D9F3|nr:MICOS complex subunit Mic10 [Drosophila teissieri]
MSSHNNIFEEQIGKKMDHCVSDILIKGCGGVIIGCAVSLTILKRRAWPVWLGAGFGIGVAYRTCERDINSLK